MPDNQESRVGNSALKQRLAETVAAYRTANPESEAANQRAQAVMPGGNTRTVLHFAPFPLTFRRGEGCRLEDLDGHTLLDFLGEYSAGLYGHSNPVIAEAITTALADGIVLGGPNRYEGELAAELCRRFPSLEQVRFTNSGTEANLMAISAARFATGRPAVMVFEGAYHGGVLYFGQTHSPINVPYPWVLGRYNDAEATLALIERHAGELAAILIEPMMGAAGGIVAERGFLAALREAASRHGILLIFDEVMTSRMSEGGLQRLFGITPDMTTLGKYLGGGASFGAFGGARTVMQVFDPRRPDGLPHAGTFNNNVLSMAAGLAGLTQVFTATEAERLTAAGDALRRRLNERATAASVPLQVLGIGSILGVHFKQGPISRPQDTWPRDALAAEALTDLQALLHLELIATGIYVARRGYLTLSLPMGESELAAFEAAFAAFLAKHGAVVREEVRD